MPAPTVSDLTLANLRALAITEQDQWSPTSTWRCTDKTEVDCYASCGQCHNTVSGKGNLKGFHFCW